MNKKIINNAISAYFGLGILLLFTHSQKENINHPFVKNHAKTAFFIHMLMFINYLIFITYGFLNSIQIYIFSLNHIFASLIFLGLFGLLLYGISKAGAGNEFSIGEVRSMSKTDTIIEFKNSNLNEQGIITIILSLIPILGFIIKGKFKNYKSPILETNLKLNLFVTLLISLFFIFQNNNLGGLFILLYTIFIVFYSILIITKKNIITLKGEKIKTIEEIYLSTKSIVKYLHNYLTGKKFTGLSEIIDHENHLFIEKNKTNKEYLLSLKENKLPQYIAYIPYLNIISLIDIHSKNKFHIINGLFITFLSLLIFILGYNNYQILILFPVFFGFGYTKIIEYRFPFLFDIYEGFSFIFGKIFRFGKVIKTKQNEFQEVTFTNPDVGDIK